jgi:hypothetical protein
MSSVSTGEPVRPAGPSKVGPRAGVLLARSLSSLRARGGDGRTTRSGADRAGRRANPSALSTKRIAPVDLGSTSTRTFVVFPVLGIGLRLLLRRPLRKRYFPLLAWGYGQYRWSGNYRTAKGGGGPGMGVPPEQLVTTGIYRYTRNPMYLGHLVFLAGLALVLRSPLFGALLGWHLPWFDRRAREDEERLQALFGTPYLRYRDEVPRWIPGIPTAHEGRTCRRALDKIERVSS